jgi:hypothetical protein
MGTSNSANRKGYALTLSACSPFDETFSWCSISIHIDKLIELAWFRAAN